ncbi:MAG: type II toxin-antitoxin system PemK/MazF family toxin [Candidatus Taylorbacteria bacterium]|nr:type II toxin-antitoxin system PemK/MazF family toxin [Candidatus Taylorbacteria bacterium]
MKTKEDLLKLFKDWAILKPKIHFLDRSPFPNKREIWWASVGQNIGVETNGKNDHFERPVLVIKVFNKDSSLIAPISSKMKSGKYFFEFLNIYGEENIINLSQLRTLSSRRLLRKIGELDNSNFEKVIDIIKSFFR